MDDFDDFDELYDFENDHPYEDDIEDTIDAWKSVAKTFDRKVGKLYLHDPLSKINCEYALTDQFNRIGMTQFHNYVFTNFFRKRFQRFKRNFTFSNKQTSQKKNISKI